MSDLVVNNVPTKSAWMSKINWTALVGPLVGVLTMFGVQGVSEDMLLAIITGIWAAQSVVTVLFRTFFTESLTYNSAISLVGHQPPVKKTAKKK